MDGRAARTHHETVTRLTFASVLPTFASIQRIEVGGETRLGLVTTRN